MLPGPAFNVEMLTSSRRRRYYTARVVYAGALLVAFWNVCSEPVFQDLHRLQLATTANLTADFFGWFARRSRAVHLP